MSDEREQRNRPDIDPALEGFDKILLVNREEFLTDTSKYFDEDLIALKDFMNRIAEDDNVQGFALSSIKKYGGIYTHFIVRNLRDTTIMGNTLEVTQASFDLLESASQQSAGASSYVLIGNKSPEEFAEWFKEEFQKPPKYRKNSKDGVLNFFELTGSKEDLELLSVVMFE